VRPSVVDLRVRPTGETLGRSPTGETLEDCHLAVYSPIQIEFLSRVGQKSSRPINVHLKIDTGTSRLGVLPEQAEEMVRRIEEAPGVKLTGLFTHYSSSESRDQSFTDQQTEKFRQTVEKLKREFKLEDIIVHAGCSASTLVNEKTFFDLVRAGIGLYGLWPSPATRELAFKQGAIELQPALSWKTKIIQVKTVATGAFVGYDRTYRTDQQSKLAIIPVGYWDGLDRSLSNKGEVLVQGQRCPIRGNICMNLTIIDVSALAEVKEGEEAVLIGRQGKETITAEEMAARAKTINYEVVTRINPQLPRRYV